MTSPASRQTLTLRASRPLDPEAAELLRQSGATLTALLRVVPGLDLTLAIGSDDQGRPRLELRLAGADEVAAIAQDLSSTLDRAFVVARSRGTSRSTGAPTYGFERIPVATSGFGPRGAQTARVDLPWVTPSGFRDEFGDRLHQWLALSQRMPGLSFELNARRDADAVPSKELRVTPRVVGPASPLPMLARAHAAGLLPELVLTREPESGLSLVSSAELAADLLQWPTHASRPIAGLPVAEASVLERHPRWGEDLTGDIRLGHAVTPHGEREPVMLSSAEAQQHVQVVGQTGTGKSSLLAAYAHAVAPQHGMLVFDVHGTLADRVLAELPEECADRTWFLDFGDVDNLAPINPFATTDPDRVETVIQDGLAMFYELFDPKRTGIVGPLFEEGWSSGMRTLSALVGSRASILSLPSLFREPRLQRLANGVDDPELRNYWREMDHRSTSNRAEVTGWFTSKFSRFTNSRALRMALETGHNAIEMASAMDEGRIVIVKAPKRVLGDMGARMLGFLLLSGVWTGFLTRETTRPFHIVLDEAQSFQAGALPALLTEGRKFGAALCIAHQYMSALDEPLREALDGSAATIAAFRTSVKDAHNVAERLGSTVTTDRLTAQPNLHAVLMRHAMSAGARPHTLVVDHNEVVRARTGRSLATWVARIRERTIRDLVEPYRGLAPLTTDEFVRVANELRDARAEVDVPTPAPEHDGGQDSGADVAFDSAFDSGLDPGADFGVDGAASGTDATASEPFWRTSARRRTARSTDASGLLAVAPGEDTASDTARERWLVGLVNDRFARYEAHPDSVVLDEIYVLVAALKVAGFSGTHQRMRTRLLELRQHSAEAG